ncbi:hypothetical protein [Pseudanabaena sp. PCC 6802]|uniref:hypothetical protein n=1 Tax=Pseudanabaena sp. PCC 6802 TaxID=118173 RepID=UPI0003469CDA|nr:hypothetical protein [Pseudanabaena sp. PCC 6802]
MLKSYEAVCENGRVKWSEGPPPVLSALAILTVLEETALPIVKRRFPPVAIAGKGKTLGNIVSSIVDEENRECLTA